MTRATAADRSCDTSRPFTAALPGPRRRRPLAGLRSLFGPGSGRGVRAMAGFADGRAALARATGTSGAADGNLRTGARPA